MSSDNPTVLSGEQVATLPDRIRRWARSVGGRLWVLHRIVQSGIGSCPQEWWHGCRCVAAAHWGEFVGTQWTQYPAIVGGNTHSKMVWCWAHILKNRIPRYGRVTSIVWPDSLLWKDNDTTKGLARPLVPSYVPKVVRNLFNHKSIYQCNKVWGVRNHVTLDEVSGVR